MSMRLALANYIRQYGLMRGDFPLNSGVRVDSYIDVMRTISEPEGYDLAGKAVAERIRHLPFTALGGPESKAIALACAALKQFDGESRRPKLFFTRRFRKDHGTMNMIEGNIYHRDKVVLIEDVTTSGKTLLAAMGSLYDNGIDIVAVVPLVDRSDGSVVNAIHERAQARATNLAARGGVAIAQVYYLPVLYAADLGLQGISTFQQGQETPAQTS